jgi:ATP-binding cassette subfamily B protein
MKFLEVVSLVTPRFRTLLLIVVLLLLVSGLALLQPILAGQLTEGLLSEPGDRRFSISAILGAWFALLVTRSVVQVASDYLSGSAGELMASALRRRLYQHMQLLPLPYHQERRAGDVLSLLSNDAETFSDFVTNTLLQLLPLLATFFGALLLMVWIDLRIGLLAGLLVPLYFLVIKLVGRRIRPLARALLDAYGDILSIVEENLKLLPIIKNFVREEYELERFRTRNLRVLDLSKRQLMQQSVLGPSMGMIAGVGLLLLLWLGSAEMERGGLSAAELVQLVLFALLLSQPLRGLASVYGMVQLGLGAAERILDFLAEQEEPEDDAAVVLEVHSGVIEFRAVSFGYQSRDLVLRNLDLLVGAGETVAITGLNGCGKSTLVYLLLRHADPSVGRICVDGMDIRSVTLASLRSSIGVVSQHTLLHNGTIAENIAYGNPTATPSEIERAAEYAQAAGFIKRLPLAYETIIGDQGLKLSGGERQRLALARALLIDPPILVFDEATSMFDPEGENAFVAAGGEFIRGKTVLLITHRPSSLALADRVLELREGRLYAV